MRTMSAAGKAAQCCKGNEKHEDPNLRNESRWTGAGKTRLSTKSSLSWLAAPVALSTGETILYSGRDDMHMQVSSDNEGRTGLFS